MKGRPAVARGRAKHASSQRTTLPQIPTLLGWEFLSAPALLLPKPNPLALGFSLVFCISMVRCGSGGVGGRWACEARLVAEDYAPANSHPFGVGILVRSGSAPPQTEPAGAGLRFGFLYFDGAVWFGRRRGDGGRAQLAPTERGVVREAWGRPVVAPTSPNRTAARRTGSPPGFMGKRGRAVLLWTGPDGPWGKMSLLMQIFLANRPAGPYNNLRRKGPPGPPGEWEELRICCLPLFCSA